MQSWVEPEEGSSNETGSWSIRSNRTYYNGRENPTLLTLACTTTVLKALDAFCLAAKR